MSIFDMFQNILDWLLELPWPSIVAALGGFIIVIGSLKWNVNHQMKKRLKRAMIIAGCLTLIGAIWSALQSSKFENIIREQSNTISNTIAGGDSFCYLSITPDQAPPFSGMKDHFAGQIIHKGDYTLYDVSVLINNQTASWIIQNIQESGNIVSYPLTKLPIRKEGKYWGSAPYEYYNEEDSIMLKTNHNLVIGNLAKDYVYQMSPILPIYDSARQDYWINILSRNGTLMQFLLLRKVNNTWFQATQVRKQGEIIFQDISEQFPIHPDSIDWGAGINRLFE